MSYLKISRHIGQATPNKAFFQLNRKQVETLKTATGVVLAIVGAAGAVALSAVAPNVFSAIGSLAKNKSKRYTHKEKQEQTARAFYYLKRHGLIEMKPAAGEVKISLTEKGNSKFKKLGLAGLSIPKQKRWDGRFWQVAADIPTRDFRRAADLLRRKLKELDFYPLQRTLWFYPFDPRKEIEFIVQQYGIERFVTVMEINRLDVDDEAKLCEYFKKNEIL